MVSMSSDGYILNGYIKYLLIDSMFPLNLQSIKYLLLDPFKEKFADFCLEG